jgi:hypothetical protein
MKLVYITLCFVCFAVSYLAFNSSDHKEKFSNNKKEAKILLERELDRCLDEAFLIGYDSFSCTMPYQLYRFSDYQQMFNDVVLGTARSLRSVGYLLGCEMRRKEQIFDCVIMFQQNF